VGPVVHSYSIASAPFETKQDGYLEFYVVLQKDGEGHPGRLTEVLFNLDLGADSKIFYIDQAEGNFTLERRVKDSRNVLFVGTGTGMAPFVSMIKQLGHDGDPGGSKIKYTLIQVSRTREELGYYDEFVGIEESGKLDFLYVPAVSRPAAGDRDKNRVGAGRANNILRRIYEMPLREEEDLRRAEAESAALEECRQALKSAVSPELPARLNWEELRSRLNPEGLVIFSCGNPQSLADIRHIANVNQIRFEREDW
jgi:ferredoxin-NADP reductase